MTCGKIETYNVNEDIDFKLNNDLINSVFYERLENYLKDFNNNVSFETRNDFLSETMLKTTVELNKFLRIEFVKKSIDSYPYLKSRLEGNPFITPAELKSVMDRNFIEIIGFNILITNSDKKILQMLNLYYSPSVFNSSGSSSFCALVPDIFSKFNSLKDAFSEIENFANDFTSLFSKLQNLSLNGMLQQIKSKILSLIDELVNRVKTKITNLQNTFTNVAHFKYNLNNIHDKTFRKKTEIERNLSDKNVKDLKTRVEGMISFAGDLFEKLNIEEIQFLILRFCEFMSDIENFFNDMTKPLDIVLENFNNSYSILKGVGSYNSARAISAGAKRFDESTKNDARINIGKIEPLDYDNEIVGRTSQKNRTGRIETITSIEEAEAVKYMSYESVFVKKNSPYVEYSPGTESGRQGRLGWDGVRFTEKVMLMRLAKSLGVKLIINSAFRSVATQSKLRSGDSSLPKNGYHQSGQAFDVRGSSIPNRNEFIKTARSIGFGGIGRYSWGIHIDSRSIPAEWGN